MAVRDFKQFESAPLHDSTEQTKEVSYQEYLPQAEAEKDPPGIGLCRERLVNPCWA